jgi:hypothetical protein
MGRDRTFEEIRDIHNLEFRDGDHSSKGGSNDYANDDGAIFINDEYLGHVKDFDRNQSSGKDNDDFSSMYQKHNLKKHFDGSSFNTIYDVGGAMQNRWGDRVAKSKDDDDGEGDKEPFEPLEKSDRHLELEEAYGDGAYPSLSKAQDSYDAAFNRATEAGREMNSGDYLRQRADDKREWVTDKYMPYLQTKNELSRHEGNYSAKNAIAEIGAMDINLPEYTDPMEWYNAMKDDLEDVG